MIEIVPALLVQTAEEFAERVHMVEEFAPRAQIDILDGSWKPERSWADPMVVGNTMSPVHYELHLMVKNPAAHLAAWEEIPAVKAVYFHVEPVTDAKEIIEVIRFRGWRAGIAVSPGTSYESIRSLLHYADDVLFLTVEPGASGRPFESAALEKIKSCRAEFPVLPISVDGALSTQTIPLCKLAGATRFIVNSALYNTPSPADTYKKFSLL